MYIYFINTSPDSDSRGGANPPMGDRLSIDRFAALFEEHHRTLWYVAAAVLSDRTHAHDVVQEAAMIAMKKLDEFDPATSFASWMSQIVRFVAMNQARKERRHRGVGNDDERNLLEGIESAGTTVVALVGSNEDSDKELTHAVAMLDEKSRTCLLLRTVRGLPYAAIAATMQMPEGTVMSMVHRAKSQLRAALTTDPLKSSGVDGAKGGVP